MFRTLNTISPFLKCFPYHRSPSACLEGTHGDRVAGDNANAIDFVTIASSLCATSSTRIDCYRPLFMSLVRGRKESKLVRSLVLHIKLGVRLARRRCGSCSVFEVAHTVYKHAMNECSFGCGCPTRNCNEVAISLAQSANITVAKSNNIMHEFVHITFIALRLAP